MRRRHRHTDLWRALALQESKALRELYRAHGRIPRTGTLTFPILEQTRLRLVLDGRRTVEDPVDDLDLGHDDGCGEARGTNRGHARHRRRHEEPCSDCARAHSDYVQERKQRRRKSDGTVSA